MCEKKPGPRCSADAQKSIRDLNAKIENQTAILKQAEKEIDEAEKQFKASGHVGGYAMLDDAYERAAHYSSLLGTYRQQLATANLNYNATPEGMKSLEKLMQAAGNSVIQEPASMVPMEEMELFGTKDETIYSPLLKRKLYADKLANAESQREWQRTTLKELTKTEEKGKDYAKFVAINLIANSEAQKAAIEKKNKEVINERYLLLAKIRREGLTPEHANRLTELEYARKNLKDQYGYTQIRINDLESYANDMQDAKDVLTVKDLRHLMHG